MSTSIHRTKGNKRPLAAKEIARRKAQLPGKRQSFINRGEENDETARLAAEEYERRRQQGREDQEEAAHRHRQRLREAERRAPLRFISLTEVCDRTCYSRWWIRDAINAGSFPKPVRTDGRTLFVEHEIEAWIAERIAERDAGAAA